MDPQKTDDSNPAPEPVFCEALRQRAREYLINRPGLRGLVSVERYCEAMQALHEAEQVPGLIECIVAEIARLEKTGEFRPGFPLVVKPAEPFTVDADKPKPS